MVLRKSEQLVLVKSLGNLNCNMLLPGVQRHCI